MRYSGAVRMEVLMKLPCAGLAVLLAAPLAAQALPMTQPLTGHRIVVSIPFGLPLQNAARVDLGRERFRYQTIRTYRDAQGRLRWAGLPRRPGARLAR